MHEFYLYTLLYLAQIVLQIVLQKSYIYLYLKNIESICINWNSDENFFHFPYNFSKFLYNFQNFLITLENISQVFFIEIRTLFRSSK